MRYEAPPFSNLRVSRAFLCSCCISIIFIPNIMNMKCHLDTYIPNNYTCFIPTTKKVKIKKIDRHQPDRHSFLVYKYRIPTRLELISSSYIRYMYNVFIFSSKNTLDPYTKTTHIHQNICIKKETL